MKTSSTWNFRSVAGKIMMVLVLTSMIGSMDVAPAIGKDNDKRMENHDNGRYNHRGRGYDYNRRVHRSYGYSERGYYPPPPVVYAPPQPPGISIFFPPFFIPIR